MLWYWPSCTHYILLFAMQNMKKKTPLNVVLSRNILKCKTAIILCLSFSLQIQNIQLEREMALASNRSLAEQNLDMKPRVESEKEVLVERYSQLEAIRETYRQHCSLRGKWEGGREGGRGIYSTGQQSESWSSGRRNEWERWRGTSDPWAVMVLTVEQLGAHLGNVTTKTMFPSSPAVHLKQRLCTDTSELRHYDYWVKYIKPHRLE